MGQKTARDAREIVMLVMVANVVGHVIHNTVVRVSLLSFDELVMLRDRVSGHGVNAHAEERTAEEVEERLGSEIHEHEDVPGDDDDPVGDFVLVVGLGADEHRAECVKGPLELNEDHLAERGAEQPGLEMGRNVAIDLVYALVGVVLEMVTLEGR